MTTVTQMSAVERVYRSILSRSGATTESAIRRVITGTVDPTLPLTDLQAQMLDEFRTDTKTPPAAKTALSRKNGTVYFDGTEIGMIDPTQDDPNRFMFYPTDGIDLPITVPEDGVISTTPDGVVKKLRRLVTDQAASTGPEEAPNTEEETVPMKIDKMNEKRRSRKKAKDESDSDSDLLDSGSDESSASDKPKKDRGKSKKDKAKRSKRKDKSDASGSDTDPVADNKPARGDDAKILKGKAKALAKLVKSAKKKERAPIEAMIEKVEKALTRAQKREDAKSDDSDVDPLKANRPSRGDDLKTLKKKKRALAKLVKSAKKKERAPIEAMIEKVEKAIDKAGDGSDKPTGRGRRATPVDMSIFKKDMKIELKDGRTGVIVKVDKKLNKLVVQPDETTRTKTVMARAFIVKGKKAKPKNG